MTSPGRTGYSPLRMWTSVPQIVVVVMRVTASPEPAWGRGTSSTRMSPGAWNTVARMVPAVRVLGRGSTSAVMACLRVAGCGSGRGLRPGEPVGKEEGCEDEQVEDQREHGARGGDAVPEDDDAGE